MASDPFEKVLPNAVATIRAASALAANDIKFHASIDHDLGQQFKHSGQSLLKIANQLLTQKVTLDQNSDTSAVLEYGDTAATSEGLWKKVSDALDMFFEKADLAMDELKKPKGNLDFQYLNDSTDAGLNVTVQEKPQIHFKVAVDNSESHPFKPKLSEKPHAIKPLEQSLILHEDGDIPAHYEQPYHEEIMNQPYPDSIMNKSEPQPSTDWNNTSAIWVETVESLNDMIDELISASEIAVDLEHHDLRSYYGITCLMQISNRSQDWIVDTLKLRDDLTRLNVVFANPQIIKVFHGANMDIVWLQRDLGLYVVSLFDTYFASKALGFPKFSLAYLLETFAKFKTSKKYQLADWRIRPLPSVMIDYARADTHFLLNIYDQLRNRLIDLGPDKLLGVLENSRKVASKRYEYVKFRPPTAYNSGMFNNDSISADNFISLYNIPLAKQSLVREIFNWRDQLARDLDESPRYIMANRVLLSICCLTEPITPQLITSCFVGFSKILRENLDLLTNLIQKCFQAMDEGEKNSVPSLPASQTFEGSSVSAQEMTELFGLLLDGAKEILQDSTENLILEKSRIFLDILSNASFSISVLDDGSKPKLVKQEEARRRLEKLRSVLSAPLAQLVPGFKEQDDNNVDEKEPSRESEENSKSSVEHKEKEAKDEIITLVPRKDRAPQQDPKPLLNEPNFDYLSVDKKLLDTRAPIIRKKKRSFQQFDASDANVPQPFKGRKVESKGKSTSYHKKR